MKLSILGVGEAFPDFVLPNAQSGENNSTISAIAEGTILLFRPRSSSREGAPLAPDSPSQLRKTPPEAYRNSNPGSRARYFHKTRRVMKIIRKLDCQSRMRSRNAKSCSREGPNSRRTP